MSTPRASLRGILDELEAYYGPPASPASSDPLELVLFENVGYLVGDSQREAALRALRRRVGLDPRSILAAPPDVLHEVAQMGGILPEQRVGKLQAISRIALRRFKGDLRGVVKRPLAEAKRALKRFPGIGDPVAEKILLFSGARPLLALDSDSVRVLRRLGYGAEERSERATYFAVQEAAEPELERDCACRIRAHQLLRRHGRELCTRSHPRCRECPLNGLCVES